MCCYVIVTFRSMMWSILSITALLAELAVFMSAHWIISQPVLAAHPANASGAISLASDTKVVRALGLFLRCHQRSSAELLTVSDKCLVYAQHIGDIASPWWVVTCCFMTMAMFLLLVVALFSVFSLCLRGVGGKSIYSVSGLLQSIAGLLLVIAMALFPAGWGSERVQYDCGPKVYPFSLGTCRVGWAYYGGMLGTLLTFACALLSSQAERSSRCRKVEHDIDHGKNPVCAM